MYNDGMETRKQIASALADILQELSLDKHTIFLEVPSDLSHGDYTTTIAFQLAKAVKKSPLEAAEIVASKLKEQKLGTVEKIEVAKPGFINFWLTKDALLSELETSLDRKVIVPSKRLGNKKIMVEFAHPNTHKEMHIGHMRTLITGEALCRIFEAVGADVFRANYQGDIGPHVAKAIYGLKQRIIKGQSLEKMRGLSHFERAHILGSAYAEGSQAYEDHKEEIDVINKELYEGTGSEWDLYQETRKWSLDYYEDFYARFYTKFDQLFFESEVFRSGKEIVEANIGKVFVKENGAIVFKGEEYGLHTRVFITQAGNTTYEGKEMGNAYAEYGAFPFDKKIHVVANEQAGYFQVVFKALELIDPEKFKDKQYHVSMGMVQLTDPTATSGQVRKISSRTGDVLTVDWLLDQVKEKVKELFASGRVKTEDIDTVAEEITIGAVKHSVLKVGVGMDAAFDIEKSVTLDGNSGPYLQYTYARTQSVLAKSQATNLKLQKDLKLGTWSLELEEEQLLRMLTQFREVVLSAAEQYSPNTIAHYLFEISQQFNHFYQNCPILKAEEGVKDFRIFLTAKTGETIKKGLELLGIKAPGRM